MKIFCVFYPENCIKKEFGEFKLEMLLMECARGL